MSVLVEWIPSFCQKAVFYVHVVIHHLLVYDDDNGLGGSIHTIY
jgi:hypothetical protein